MAMVGCSPSGWTTRDQTSKMRIDGKRFFLTYPQCASTKEGLLTFLKGLAETDYVITCKELHEDGAPHLHALVLFKARYTSRNARVFDYEENHPNIQGCRSVPQSVKYIKKAGDFTEDGALSSASEKKWQVAWDCTSAEQARTAIQMLSPRDAILFRDRIESWIDWRFAEKAVPYASSFTFEPEKIPEVLRDWAETVRKVPDRPRSLLLMGSSRTGKTEWARSLGPHVYLNGMMDMQQLVNLEEAEYGVFDDFSWDHFKPFVKQWMGAQKEFTITDKYRKKKTIKWGKPCIYVCNPDQRPDLEYLLQEWWNVNVVECNLKDALF